MDEALEIILLYLSASDEVKRLVEETLAALAEKSGSQESA